MFANLHLQLLEKGAFEGSYGKSSVKANHLAQVPMSPFLTAMARNTTLSCAVSHEMLSDSVIS